MPRKSHIALTRKTQVLNGEKVSAYALAKHNKIRPNTLVMRFLSGWPVKKAATEPTKVLAPRKKSRKK